jgi:hypothetical protein
MLKIILKSQLIPQLNCQQVYFIADFLLRGRPILILGVTIPTWLEANITIHLLNFNFIHANHEPTFSLTAKGSNQTGRADIFSWLIKLHMHLNSALKYSRLTAFCLAPISE